MEMKFYVLSVGVASTVSAEFGPVGGVVGKPWLNLGACYRAVNLEDKRKMI